jgi:hypothetical protein
MQSYEEAVFFLAPLRQSGANETTVGQVKRPGCIPGCQVHGFRLSLFRRQRPQIDKRKVNLKWGLNYLNWLAIRLSEVSPPDLMASNNFVQAAV